MEIQITVWNIILASPIAKNLVRTLVNHMLFPHPDIISLLVESTSFVIVYYTYKFRVCWC